MQTTLPPGDLVQSAVVVSSTPGRTVFLEPQAVTLTELPGGTVQTLPAGSTFEGNQSFKSNPKLNIHVALITGVS